MATRWDESLGLFDYRPVHPLFTFLFLRDAASVYQAQLTQAVQVLDTAGAIGEQWVPVSEYFRVWTTSQRGAQPA
jgi:hypothetical protein